MARGINKVILVGNLGADPELISMPTGDKVATCSIATSETWKDKISGEKQERTEWHRLIFYKGLAEIAREYLKKGAKIYLEGKLRTRKWQDKESNQDRYITEIVGHDVVILDPRSTVANPGEDSQKTTTAETDENSNDIPF